MSESSGNQPIVALPISGPAFNRPDPMLLRDLYRISSATASAYLHQLGIHQTFIQGPVSQTAGAKIVGTAVTLQFMPQREDIMSGVDQEEFEQYSALWAVLETIEPNDILVIQAYGDPYTGVIGEMLLSYFLHRGGLGIVVDGFTRDSPRSGDIGIPIWSRGATPNYASQAGLIPWAYNVPVALSKVLVLPGDIVIADDDGAVVIPVQLAKRILDVTTEKEARETFIRQRLQNGGDLRTYYPLSAAGQTEYRAWVETRTGDEGIPS